MSEQFVGTMPVQERHRFDVAALETYLRGRIEGYSGPLAIEQFKGGQSNPTYRLSAGGRRYVMRSKPGPAAKLLPSAHAVDREFRVITALRQAGIPVPRTYCLCEDEAVIGRAFFIMECVEGRDIEPMPLLHRHGADELLAHYGIGDSMRARMLARFAGRRTPPITSSCGTT